MELKLALSNKRRFSHPLVYEINTRCWLWRLSQTAGRELTLADVPEGEFAAWSRLGFTHIWLMGVWRTGERGRAHSLKLAELRKIAEGACADDEISGSPYAVAAYEVSPSLGGNGALQKFRERLEQYGIQLILDFVPNHLALDHCWVSERPEFFVHSRTKQRDSARLQTAQGPLWFAHGKDPYIGAWVDTAQLDYRNPAAREAMMAELQRVANLCDGVRCDMAMLVLNDVFARTWKDWPSKFSDPLNEFWADAINAVHSDHPEFLFMAEVYWGLELRLQELGFDFTYDKRLYDHLVAKNAAAVQRHLLDASKQFLERGVHFLENHDEPRIASLLSFEEHRAAALIILGLPGLCLLHQGQLGGAVRHLNVHLGRDRTEPEQNDVASFYQRLLEVLARSSAGRGEAHLLKPREAWSGNPTAVNFVVVQWQSTRESFDLLVVNLASHRCQCYVDIKVDRLSEGQWDMRDLLGIESYVRDGSALRERGLYLDLPEHGAQIFQFRATRTQSNELG